VTERKPANFGRRVGLNAGNLFDGSATFTTLKSSCSTNWAAQISEMTNTTRREPPAAGSGAAPFVEWSAIGESPVLTAVPYWFIGVNHARYNADAGRAAARTDIPLNPNTKSDAYRPIGRDTSG
jgi:hypothetical protein